MRSKARNKSSPADEKNALSQSLNSSDRSRRVLLTNTPGFSLPRSPNRISFMCLWRVHVFRHGCIAQRLTAGAHTQQGRQIVRNRSRLRLSPHSLSRILETAAPVSPSLAVLHQGSQWRVLKLEGAQQDPTVVERIQLRDAQRRDVRRRPSSTLCGITTNDLGLYEGDVRDVATATDNSRYRALRTV